jgi:hypothetical protein
MSDEPRKSPPTWEKLAVKRALATLSAISANPAGAGPNVVAQFRGHILTILAAAHTSAEIRKMTDVMIANAEELFLGARPQGESHYRKQLVETQQKLERELADLGLL